MVIVPLVSLGQVLDVGVEFEFTAALYKQLLKCERDLLFVAVTFHQLNCHLIALDRGVFILFLVLLVAVNTT